MVTAALADHFRKRDAQARQEVLEGHQVLLRQDPGQNWVKAT